jgi:hypothetical protein
VKTYTAVRGRRDQQQNEIDFNTVVHVVNTNQKTKVQNQRGTCTR